MHHAYLYEGSQELLQPLAEHARKLFNFKKSHDPDVRVESFERFGIEDAEALKKSVSFRSVSGHALFVLGIGSITTEAQQALLKLFEEPQQGTTFVLLAPHGSLIATLRSRMLAYPEKLEAEKRSLTAAKKFLQAPVKTRSLEVAALLKDEEGVRERVRDFLNELEAHISRFNLAQPEVRQGLADIAKVRSYLGDRSPSLKLLLEHLAVSLPKL